MEEWGKRSECAQVHQSLKELPFFSAPKKSLPDNGLYFFYEEGEISGHDGEPRIVRVGNHPKSQDNLINRLKQHYRSSKNGSVFRKYLGGALIRQSCAEHPCLQPGPGKGHWEKQDAKTCDICKPFEIEVTNLLLTRFRFRCVKIDNMKERNRMEEGLIATLARCPRCRPSPAWLGRFAYNTKVQDSVLWNSEYVEGSNSLNRQELARFEELILLSL